MFRNPFPALASIAIVAAAPIGAQQVPAGDLAIVQQHLQAMTTLTADFAQTDRDGRVLTGTLKLKKPGKLRFQYQKGVPILIVAESGALTFLDYSVNQKQRWPIKDTPLGILLDPTRDISYYATILPSVSAQNIAVHVKDGKHPEYGTMDLLFKKTSTGMGGLILQGWSAFDSQNNRTIIRLSRQVYNGPISDSAFRWNDIKPLGGKK